MAVDPSSRPRLTAPPGTTDTHMHIFEGRFAVAPTAAVKPPEAPVSAYRKICERLGIERTVVVQPSAYGTDNSCTLEAMAAMAPNARGIAVVTETVPDVELERLTGAGIRGVRFFMLRGGVLPGKASSRSRRGWRRWAGTSSCSSMAGC